MTAALHDAEVASRFDLLVDRFKADVPSEDVRLAAVLRAMEPISDPPPCRGGARGGGPAISPRTPPLQGGEGDGKRRRVLDLGCGKGRFARHLERAGAEVVGLDISSRMLTEAAGLPRVKGTARRLPFADASFDAVVAIECLEHLGDIVGLVVEARRTLRPGGRLVIIDKNSLALDARRPWLPASLVKWIDERRGLWMYPAGGPVRERWFDPRGLVRALRRDFESVGVDYLLSPDEASRAVFRMVPSARKMACWTATAPGGGS